MSYELESNGGLAQLARALALQAKGHRFDSDILHITNSWIGIKKSSLNDDTSASSVELPNDEVCDETGVDSSTAAGK